jgi:integrase
LPKRFVHLHYKIKVMSKYTKPTLYTGKTITSVPKGSTKLKEQAKNIWYINYSYEGKQIRVKDNINRIKDPVEKEREANILLESIIKDLANGYNPNDETQWLEKIIKDTTSLSKAIILFKEYHVKHQSRQKTIATYLSKVNALNTFYPNLILAAITTKSLEKFVQSKIDDSTYSQNSVKSAKRIFNTFFNVCVKLELLKINPMQGFDDKIKSRKEIEEQHIPFSDEDLKTILAYLDLNDKYAAFFCRMIYYTCMRPNEIRGLKLENIDLINNTITIPASVKKVTTNNEKEILEINEGFIPFLEQLNLNQYPKHYYLTGSSTNIVGEKRVGENTPYNKLVSAMKKLELNNKGYDLYSFKHTSNIKKYMSGWTLAEIMKANRHSNISTTEAYLKNLGQFVDIKTKAIPAI